MTDITLKELVECKRKLRAELRELVSPVLQRFSRETGVAVREIRFDLVENTTYGQEPPSFTLGRIVVDLELGSLGL